MHLQANQSARSLIGVRMVKARKGVRWMARHEEPMKGVAICDKLRGGDKQPLIRRFLNGETPLDKVQ